MTFDRRPFENAYSCSAIPCELHLEEWFYFCVYRRLPWAWSVAGRTIAPLLTRHLSRFGINGRRLPDHRWLFGHIGRVIAA